MYRLIQRTKTFLKEYPKAKITDKYYTKFIVYIGKLITNEVLPAEAKDHALKGDFVGFREFHISGDLLVVYYIKDDTVYLTRIGTHSQIFG